MHVSRRSLLFHSGRNEKASVVVWWIWCVAQFVWAQKGPWPKHTYTHGKSEVLTSFQKKKTGGVQICRDPAMLKKKEILLQCKSVDATESTYF